MKCPKCGYLGFETTDRCRNCQYDFSLAPFASEPDLELQDTNRKLEPNPDFDLPPIKRQSDSLSAQALDLDRLFGDAVTAESAPPVSPAKPVPPPAPPDPPALPDPPDPPAPAPPPAATPATSMSMVEDAKAQIARERRKNVAVNERASELMNELMGKPSAPGKTPAAAITPPPVVPPEVSADGAALPFDEAPIVPPPAARPPLAVRRSTPEVPRNRPRTTRPVRNDLPLESSRAPKPGVSRQSADTVASLTEVPPLAARVGAGLIDLVLIGGVDLAVLYLTLRVSGLQNTLDDLRVLPPVPFIGFLALLGFGYVAAFTVGGGQTIGKMILSLRVIGDDGRPVDAAGGMLRALGCMLVPITLGLSYVPALFTSDHRALHDRLAGTRVVRE